MNLIPTAGRLFVKPNIEETTKGGIIIPETSRKAPTQGVVLALGKLKDERVKQGSNILFRMHSDEEVELEGETFFMIVEADVLAVLGEE